MNPKTKRCSKVFWCLIGPGLAFVVVALMLLGPVDAQAQSMEPQSISPVQMQELEAQYFNDIQPQLVAESMAGVVPTGHVILYGQMVSPPYSLVIDGDALYLNGVQIDPPLRPPWEYPSAPITVTEQNRKISGLTGRIRVAYEELENGKEQVDLQAATIQHITDAEKSIVVAEWTGPDMLAIETVTGEEFSMFLPAKSKPSDYLELRRDVLREMKQRYEADLKSGALLAIGHGPVVTVPAMYVDDTQTQIEQALSERSASKLRRALHHDELAREMLFLQDRISRKED